MDGAGGARLRLGISTCLLGENVRYDGGHKLDPYLVDVLGRFVEWVPVCPEVELGMGVPREAVRLVGDPDRPRLKGNRSGEDWTDRMLAWAGRRLEELADQDLCGFVFKHGSPSSGLERVRVHTPEGMPSKNGRGLFAAAFLRRFPWLPVEDEGRLNDPVLRENFIERVFAYHRWLELTRRPFSRGALVAFHTRYKFLVLAHSPKHYQTLGRLVAGIKGTTPRAFLASYRDTFLEALRVKATPRKHANVLQHILGFLKDRMSADEKRELLDVIEDYRREQVPLVVPLTLLKHFVRKYPSEYVQDQVYLAPHPKELMLRNRV
jgi:uncharacterized protein YbgA (DUF1722 family)/uncharacterized protein YbbK (DUF523 family)